MKIRAPITSQTEAESRTSGSPIYGIRLVLSVLLASILFGLAINFLSGKLAPLGIKEELSKIATEHGFATFQHDIRLRHAVTRTPDYLARVIRGNDFPTIAIDIEFVDVQKLEAKRREALKANKLVTSEDDFVPANIRTDDGTLKAKVRLKGDNVDHLDSSKWSMRIQIKGDDHLFGLRRFSIQHPKTRGFQGELLLHETFERFDIITPRYFFVNVIVNGDDLGIMNIEEHFSKELLERSGRKESVILKLDESLLWSVKIFEESTPFLVNPLLLYQNAVIDAFQAGRISGSPSLARDYDVAVGLLRGFTSGSLSASEAFDAELLGKYLAITDFWGAWHEIRWNNQRFYFNPFTLLLEPVAFDGNVQHRIPVDRGVVGEPIVKKMLDDPNVRDAYDRTRRLLVTQTLDGSLIEELKELERPVLDELQSEFFMLESFDYPDLIERAKQELTKVGAGGWIQPTGDFDKIPIFAHAYLVDGVSETYLELLNALPLEVEVRSIYWKDSAGNITSFQPDSTINYPFNLPETKVNGTPYSFRIPFVPPANAATSELVVVFGIEGYSKLNEIRTYTARNMAASLQKNPMPNADVEETLEHHKFLSLHEDGKTIVVGVGSWQVEGTMIIPAGFVLKIDAGTTLQFEDKACLIVYGSTVFGGREDAKIVLEGLPNGDGESGYWQGLVVHNAPDRSTWSHVIVRNTSGVEWPKWSLTGGATFYKSDVNIKDSILSGAKGEDALNIIHSDFQIEDIQVVNTASDAIDADFATGTITGGFFEEIGTLGGGDAVDVSGSEVTIDGTTFTRVHDKAISVGEGSRLTVRNATIDNVSVAVASKDGSRVDMHDSIIKQAKYAGLMAYSKKAEYGPASLATNGVRIIDTGTIAQAQIGNTLVVDGEEVQGQNIDVEGLYESVMRPGIEK
jgi:hypothetical protein